MTKTIKLLVSHPASPQSRIQIDLQVDVSDQEINQLFFQKATQIVESSMGMQVNQFLSSEENYQQLEIDFETQTNENSYQPYTGNCTFSEEESESEFESEDLFSDSLTGRQYTPYSSPDVQPPQSFHERLPGTDYTPYRSFRNPIERS